MRIVLQRVTEASVKVDDKITGQIDNGLLLLVGFGNADRDILAQTGKDAVLEKACNKLMHLRIFPNSEGKLDHSITDVDGNFLVVPQFTLYGKSEKGRRPDFTDALAPQLAEQAFNQFCDTLSRLTGNVIARGVFGADMAVSLVNDGPFTLQLSF